MTREIVLDTETTGLDPTTGDRIVEIGALELINHVPTGRTYHQYINPERHMPEEAYRVHGLSDDFLRDKPVFAQIADQFLAFIQDSKFVIHNADFDMKFLNWEFQALGHAAFGPDRAIDTLRLARRRFPGAPASLDALCKRFGVDNSNRDLHGALIDSELLAGVYLELIGGREPGLRLVGSSQDDGDENRSRRPTHAPRPQPLTPQLSDAEKAAHDAFIDGLKSDDPVWKWASPGDASRDPQARPDKD